MNQQQQTTAATADWWADDAPIPLEPDLEHTAIAVRQPTANVPARRSEYAELAELAASAGPRDTTRLLAEARRVGSLLGARAYYDFPAGGGRVTGPSIDLMDALAIVWGRLVQRVEVIEENPTRVHLRGRIVDLLALTATERDYVSAIAPAPGGFAKKPDQAERWRVMQIQSASSKAVRGALEHALPAWLVDAAMDAARHSAAQQATGGRPLAEARGMAVEALGRLGLDRATLEAVVDQPMDLWTVDELAQLRTLMGKLRSGEVAVEAVRAEAQLKAAASTAQPQGQQDRLGSLGLSKPSPSPSAQPSTGGQQQGAAPSGGGMETKPPKDAGAAAAALRERVRERLDRGDAIWADEAKTEYKAALGIRQTTLGAFRAALSYGAERGWWTVTEQRNEAGEVTGYGLAPVPAAEPVLSGDELRAAIGEIEGKSTREQLAQAATAIGAAVGDDGFPVVDEDDDVLRRYLAALREARS